MRRRRENTAYDGPKVLILHEHHETVYMDASTKEAFERSVLRILKGRLTSDMFVFDVDERLEAERVLARSDADGAWDILQDRKGYESEQVDLEKVMTRYHESDK